MSTGTIALIVLGGLAGIILFCCGIGFVMNRMLGPDDLD